MLKKSFFILSWLLLCSCLLSACQSVEKNSQIIASAFNTATQVQKKLLDHRTSKSTVSVLANIPYSQQPDLYLDIYLAQKTQQQLIKQPTVVWIHGGGWIAGNKEHARGYFKLLAEQGYNVVSIEYQFAPQYIYPTQLQQIDQALDFISQHADQYGIDAQKLYLAGDSAGANLASHYAALATNTDFAKQSDFQVSIQAKQIRGLILHCGIYDLKSFIAHQHRTKLFTWGINNIVQAYTGHAKEDSEFLASISPSLHLTPDYPPVFISGGKHDFLTETQALDFVEHLKAQNIAMTEVFYPDSKELLIHEYQFMMSKKASQETLNKTIEFLQFYSQD